MLARIRALKLLSECDGDHIWSVEHCRKQGVPEEWILEMVDGYESGFNHDRETIYYGDKPVVQFEGIRDFDLALRLATFLKVRTEDILATQFSRRSVVRAIKEKFEDD
jgi:hypothetical protein